MYIGWYVPGYPKEVYIGWYVPGYPRVYIGWYVPGYTSLLCLPGYMVGIHTSLLCLPTVHPWVYPAYTHHPCTVSAVQGVVQWPAVRALGSNPGIVWENEAHRAFLSPRV